MYRNLSDERRAGGRSVVRDRCRLKRGISLTEVLVVIAMVAVLAGLLLPAVQRARAAARRTHCANHLRQLAVALHSYHDVHRVLPPGAMLVGPSFGTASGWGWGAMLLPYLEQQPLFSEIDFNIGTATGQNINSINHPLSGWRCPSDVGPSVLRISIPEAGTFDVAHGNYAANDALMTGLSAIRFRNILDGLSSTALVSERAWRDDSISRPFTSSWIGILATSDRNVFDSVPFVEMTAERPVNYLLGGSDCFSSYHGGGAQIGFADSSVRFVGEDIDQQIYAALGTISSGDQAAFE